MSTLNVLKKLRTDEHFASDVMLPIVQFLEDRCHEVFDEWLLVAKDLNVVPDAEGVVFSSWSLKEEDQNLILLLYWQEICSGDILSDGCAELLASILWTENQQLVLEEWAESASKEIETLYRLKEKYDWITSL